MKTKEKILKIKRAAVNIAIPILLIYILYINSWLLTFIKAVLIIGVLLFFGAMLIFIYLSKQIKQYKTFCSIAEEETEVN